MDVFVGRQPIFTSDKKIFGYELLFRSGHNNAFPGFDGDIATYQVLSNTFLSEIGDTILRGKPGFVNFTRNLICNQLPLVFSKDQVFIEVLENIDPEPEVLKALRLFKKKGFVIVLDDFVYDEKFKEFIDLCDIIKFDILNTPLDSIDPVIDAVLDMKRITLLAGKVESHEEFVKAVEKGFTLFQGYFFAKPEVVAKKSLTANQISKLRLLAESRRVDPDLTKIKELVKLDVSLSFKLLKLVNSSYFHRRSSINTIKDAIIVMGLENLRKFIDLAVVGSINGKKPDELVRLAIIRASLCEQIGGLIHTVFTPDELFTVGLFSLMDAMLDIRMEDFVAQVDFSPKMARALMGKDVKIQEILQVIFSCEKMDQRSPHIFPDVFRGTDLIGSLSGFYQNALKMADSIYQG